ncbi:helix-turn-helix domain-containing protein [Natrononativus amylolyticus]|uniref:helix-turn-helix domain-containing protein n=1 Tax=Natrononativus amylolyticus TaxID=2963434 RepID=UPI0020CF75D1|nr:helix-turn-helix domain-containing protein [Natrononativus amylolyticus]
MATLVDLHAPASETALGTTFERVPSLECELEQAAVAGFPGVWCAGVARSDLEDALAADPSVERYELLRTRDDESFLYNLELADEITEILKIPIDEGGTILAASAADGTWLFRMRFPDRCALSRTFDRIRDRDVDTEVVRLQELTGETVTDIGLTAEQYEALRAAVEHGYYDIPRRTSMQDLADELDISHQALSERLRRAYRTLVSAELEEGSASPVLDLE